MNQELQIKLNNLLEYLESSLKTGTEFVAGQTPLYVQELLAYHFWTSLIGFGVGAAVLIAYAAAIWKILIPKTKEFGDHFLWYMGFGFGGIFSFCIGANLVVSNFDWFKISVAPRVFLVEYVSKQIK